MIYNNLLRNDATELPSPTLWRERKDRDFPSVMKPHLEPLYFLPSPWQLPDFVSTERAAVTFDPGSCLPGFLSCMQVLLMAIWK